MPYNSRLRDTVRHVIWSLTAALREEEDQIAQDESSTKVSSDFRDKTPEEMALDCKILAHLQAQNPISNKASSSPEVIEKITKLIENLQRIKAKVLEGIPSNDEPTKQEGQSEPIQTAVQQPQSPDDPSHSESSSEVRPIQEEPPSLFKDVHSSPEQPSPGGYRLGESPSQPQKGTSIS